MTDDEPSGVVPIDPEIREVLREFSENPIDLASEIVRLRSELETVRGERPHVEVLLRSPQPPPDAPPPVRLVRTTRSHG
jgi:hypothetical protein